MIHEKKIQKKIRQNSYSSSCGNISRWTKWNCLTERKRNVRIGLDSCKKKKKPHSARGSSHVPYKLTALVSKQRLFSTTASFLAIFIVDLRTGANHALLRLPLRCRLVHWAATICEKLDIFAHGNLSQFQVGTTTILACEVVGTTATWTAVIVPSTRYSRLPRPALCL